MATKPQKTVVIAIVRGLDKGQAMYVRGRLRGRQLVLYDFYSTSKKFESAPAAMEAVGVEGNVFSVLKSKLESSLTRILGELASKGNPRTRILALETQAAGYLQCDLFDEAAQLLEKAAELATASEEFQLAIDLKQRIRALRFQDMDEHWLVRFSHLIACLAENAEWLGRVLEAQRAKLLPRTEATAWARMARKSISESALPATGKARIFRLRTLVIANSLLLDLNGSRTLVETGLQLLEDCPDLLFDSMIRETMVAMVAVQASICVMDGDPMNGKKMIVRQVERLKRVEIEVPPELAMHGARMDVIVGKLTNDPGKIMQSLHGMTKLHASKKPVTSRAMAQYLAFVSSSLLSMEKYNESKIALEALRVLNGEGWVGFWKIIGSMMDVVCLLELGNYDDLDAAVKRAEEKLKRYPNWIPKSNPVIKAFRRIARNSIQEKESLGELLESESVMKTDETYRLLLSSLDLFSWARARIGKL